ncbi:hypothetical protein Efla_001666 [Eimeria flavescens]
MVFIVGDDSGLCKALSCNAEDTSLMRIIKSAKQARSLAVTALCWSGRAGGGDFSEIAVGRACGTVEAFATGASALETSSTTPSTFDRPLRSLQLPSEPLYLSLIGSEKARAYTRSLICSEWLADEVTPGVASLRNRLQFSPSSIAGQSLAESSPSSPMVAVGRKGHTCVVDWRGSFCSRLCSQSSKDEDLVLLSDPFEGVERKKVALPFKPVVPSASGIEVVETETAGDAFCCKAGYLLPDPVDAASCHPLCSSLLAFGGKNNDAKVLDLDCGKLLWAAKNVKASFLGVRCEVAVTQLDWLLAVHPMVLVAGSARGGLRFYDLRCQRRPVLEVCEATQARRPVTALCLRPTTEVLMQQTGMRIALARAAEVASSGNGCRTTAQPSALAVEGKPDGATPVLTEVPHWRPSLRSGESFAAVSAAKTLLSSSCSGKESAAIYYADSFGMIYGLRVLSGSKLSQLAKSANHKYRRLHLGSLKERRRSGKPADDHRRRVSAMLDERRQVLTSKKNDHPIAAASCVALQLGAIPLGGFKGAIGAVVGLALDSAGERLIAVGLGRHAYFFQVKSRKLLFQVFMKQKLTCLLTGAEEASGCVAQSSSRPDMALTARTDSTGPNGKADCRRKEDGTHSVSELESVAPNCAQSKNSLLTVDGTRKLAGSLLNISEARISSNKKRRKRTLCEEKARNENPSAKRKASVVC